MKALILFALFALLNVAQAAKDPLRKVTNKVYLDIEIGGKSAGFFFIKK